MRPFVIVVDKPLSIGMGKVLFTLLSQAGAAPTEPQLLTKSIPPRAVALLLGERAFAKYNKGNIHKCRGSVYQYGDCNMIGTFSPMELMRMPEMWPAVVHDIHRAWTMSRKEKYQVQVRKYITRPYKTDLIEWIKNVDMTQPVGLDVETDGAGVMLHMVGLGQKKAGFICVPMSQDMLPYLIYFFKNFQAGYIMQNGNFDRGVIWRVFGKHLKAAGDTIIAHHLLCSEMPHDLGFISSLYSDIPYHKDTSKADLALYNLKDVDSTMQAHEGLMFDLERDGLMPLYKTMMEANEVIFKSVKRGLAVHLPTLNKFRIEYKEKEKVLLQELKDLAKDQHFNPASPQQVATWLYTKLKLPQVFKSAYGRTTKKLTTGTEDLVKKFPNSVEVQKLVEWRHLAKMLSTYLLDFEKGEKIDLHFEQDTKDTVIIHVPVKIHGQVGGRYSSFIHTWPPAMRAIIIPREGNIFIQGDFSQIEWRLGAFLSQDPVALDILHSGRDIHRMSAALAFGIPESEVTSDQRHKAKRISHGSSYGIGLSSIALQFGISVAEAMEVQNKILHPFKRLIEWREENLAFVEKNGYLTNPFGRRRYFIKTPKAGLRGEVFAFLQQSTCHDMLVLSANAIDRERGNEIFLVLDHHDANVHEVSIDIVEEAKVYIKSVMEREHLPGFSCPADLGVGLSWKACKA